MFAFVRGLGYYRSMETLKEVTSQVKWDLLDECKELLEAHYGNTGSMYAHLTGVMSALLSPSQIVDLNDSVKRFIDESKEYRERNGLN